MRSSCVAKNIYVDGDPYLKGLFGLSLIPSAEAKRNAANYEADIDWILKCLGMKFTSSRVIVYIAQHPKRVVIRPRPIPPRPDENTPPDQRQDDYSRYYNAETAADSEEDAQPPVNDPVTGRTTGTGHGSDAQILFNPGVYADAMGAYVAEPNSRRNWARERSDRVLLHEMVHALSDVSGRNAKSGYWSTVAGYGSLEEFTACTVRNVYTSETGSPVGELKDHDDQPLRLLLTSSVEFYNQYRQAMQEICINHRFLARDLKRATGIQFNPFIYCNVN